MNFRRESKMGLQRNSLLVRGKRDRIVRYRVDMLFITKNKIRRKSIRVHTRV